MATPRIRKNDPEDPRDDGDDGGGGSAGGIVLVIVAVAVAIFTIASVAGILKSFGSSPPPAGTTTCSTQCWGFVKLECPGDRYMGPCFGFWGCGGTDTHRCGTNP